MTKAAGRNITAEAENLWSLFSLGFWKGIARGVPSLDEALLHLWKSLDYEGLNTNSQHLITSLFMDLDSILKEGLLRFQK